MPAEPLIELLKLLEEAQIEVWLDGGWGIDALLQEQTRPHKDVDLIPRVEDVPKLLETLGRRGFRLKEGEPPNSFVIADGSGLEVDLHPVAFDEFGNGHYKMANGEVWVYPAEGFSGRGAVQGVEVRCLSPEIQVLRHATGYEPTGKDIRDMALLKARFGVILPPNLKPSQGLIRADEDPGPA